MSLRGPPRGSLAEVATRHMTAITVVAQFTVVAKKTLQSKIDQEALFKRQFSGGGAGSKVVEIKPKKRYLIPPEEMTKSDLLFGTDWSITSLCKQRPKRRADS